MSYKIFIDGSSGTTGLQLKERLSGRENLDLLQIESEHRHDPEKRRALMEEADVVFLCLPDDAAVEAAALCPADKILIDASTAHRTNDSWDYGLPELSAAHRAAISRSKRIANPGCYATGAICILYPLVVHGMLLGGYPVTVNAVSGYSGGGKKMIAAYEGMQRENEFIYPRGYALSLHHKHVPEIQKVSGLSQPPIFAPQVCNFYEGMAVSVPLFPALLNGSPGKDDIYEMFCAHYAGQRFVKVSLPPESGFISAGANSGTNELTIYVYGNDQQVVLTSILDNLGKGASGAAVQNMNIALGLPEETYLV